MPLQFHPKALITETQYPTNTPKTQPIHSQYTANTQSISTPTLLL